MKDTAEIKTKLAREPFRSFVVELVSGRQIVVTKDSEVFMPRKRSQLVYVFTEDGLVHEFEIEFVISIIEL